MGRWGMALLAAGAALVAASARAQSGPVVLAPSVYATHELPSNAITAFTAGCAAGYVATSAGVSAPAPGTTLLSLAPVGVHAYRFRLGNPVGNGDQRVTVAVACRAVSPAGGRAGYALRLRPLAPRFVVVAPRKAAGASLECPRGTAPAGAGVDLDPGRQQSPAAYRGALPLSVLRQSTTLSRFSFSVLNTGAQARTVGFYGGCVTLLRAAGAAPQRLRVELSTARVRVRPGSQTLTRDCRRGWFSLAAGYALRSKLVVARGAVAVGAQGRWALASDAQAETKADLQLACGRLSR